MAPSPRAPALGAGNHTGPAAMNESKEEGCTGIAVGLLQVVSITVDVFDQSTDSISRAFVDKRVCL